MYGRVNVSIVYTRNQRWPELSRSDWSGMLVKNKRGPKVRPCTWLLRFSTT